MDRRKYILPLFQIEAVGGLLAAERQAVLDRRRAAGWTLFAVTDLFLYFTKIGD